jgi:hypothetical protein
MLEMSSRLGARRNIRHDNAEPLTEEEEGLLAHDDETSRIVSENKNPSFAREDEDQSSSRTRSRIRLRQKWGAIPIFGFWGGELSSPPTARRRYWSLCLNCFFFSSAVM